METVLFAIECKIIVSFESKEIFHLKFFLKFHVFVFTELFVNHDKSFNFASREQKQTRFLIFSF